MLLQRVDNRFYVREKLEVMFRKAVVSNLSNRLGLAMGFGLVCWILPFKFKIVTYLVQNFYIPNHLKLQIFIKVAAAHLDTVLEKLKRILESQSRNTFQR